MSNLFQQGVFKLHSGELSNFKIECGALILGDWEALAKIIAQSVYFTDVVGIATGGTSLAAALDKYKWIEYRGQPWKKVTLIVDDVLMTGASMEEAKLHIEGEVRGIVVFARKKCPDWVDAIFQMPVWFL